MAATRRSTDRECLHVFHSPRGMTVIVKENHSTPLVSMAAYLQGGVRAEDVASNGVTAFSRRLLMKGTQSRSAEDVALELEFLGASMSPFTGKDVCGATLSCLSKHFAKALEVFADCHLAPVFTAEAVERERRNILTDIEKKKDDTLSYCLELCEGALHGAHPYGLSVTGSEESVRGLEQRDLEAWHRRLCSQSRMVVAVVGDVRAAPSSELIMQAFAGLPELGGVLPDSIPVTPLAGVREVVVRREKRQVAVALGYHAPALGSADFAAFDVLEHVLSGMGSRLFVELRDKQGLAYVVNCSYDARKDGGAFRIYIGTSEERREQSREAMIRELGRLCQQRVSREELARTKRYLLGLREISLQRNGAQASRLAYYECMGRGYQLLREYPKMIRGVRAEDVQAVAERYLATDAYALAQVL